MARTLKIYDDEKEIYSGPCSVNTVVFKGRIFNEFKNIGANNKGISFSLQLSNGKDNNTGEWNKPTFADCSAFGEVAEKIKAGYQIKDEIFLIAKYHRREYEGRYYKCFIVKNIVQNNKEPEQITLEEDFLPF